MSRPTDILATDGTVNHIPYRTPCPYCARPNNAAVFSGETEGATPHDGDVAICWGCQRPSRWTSVDGRLALAAYTAEEEAQVLADPQVRRVLAAMRAHETRGPSLAARVARKMGPTP